MLISCSPASAAASPATQLLLSALDTAPRTGLGQPALPSPIPGSAHTYSHAPVGLRVNEVRTYLVVQGPSVPLSLIADLERITQADGATVRLPSGVLHADAYRLSGVVHTPAVQQQVEWLLAYHAVDFGFVPGSRTLDTVGIAMFDMDETLTCGDSTTLLRNLIQGAEEEERKLRRDRDAKGLYKFDPGNKRKRTRLLAGLPEAHLLRLAAEVTAPANAKPGAEAGLAAFGHTRRLVCSGGFTHFTEPLITRYKLDGGLAIQLEVRNGILTGRILGDTVAPRTKARYLKREMAAIANGKHATVVGDSDNDAHAFDWAVRHGGVAFAYHANHPAARAAATHTIDHTGLDGIPNYYLPAA